MLLEIEQGFEKADLYLCVLKFFMGSIAKYQVLPLKVVQVCISKHTHILPKCLCFTYTCVFHFAL